MEMYSKMDGPANVSKALGGVWKIQKKGWTDDKRNENRKNSREKKEEETDFEDGRVLEDQEIIMDAETKTNDENAEKTDPEDANASSTRKIDLII
jgi:hypothetical protein